MFTEAFWFDTSGVGEVFCNWSVVLISRHGEVFLLSRGKSSLVSRIRSIWTGDRCREPRSGWGERDTFNEPFSGPLSASLSPSFGMAEARSARRSSDNRLFWRLNILFLCISSSHIGPANLGLPSESSPSSSSDLISSLP